VAQRFARFLSDLEPGAGLMSAVAAAGTDTEALLVRWFRTRTRVRNPARAPRPPRTVEVGGGFANGTALAASPTVDLLVAFPDDIRPPTDARGRDPRFTFAFHRLTDLLGQRYGAVETDPCGWISVCTDRSAPTPLPTPVRIRLLPAFRCAGGGALLVTEPGRMQAGAAPWRHVHIEAHRRWLGHIDRISGNKARHLVRLVKAWRTAVDAPLSGFAIELLVCEFLSVWLYRRRSLLFYDWMIRDFFFWLAAQSGRSLPVPGTIEVLPIGDRWLAAAERAHVAARKAADLERDNDSVAALGCWREIFGLGFCGQPAAAVALTSERHQRRKA
jgi:hypothetical protein